MPDTLRERIARAVAANVTNADGFPLVSYDDATRIINAILPLVEQAIQQARIQALYEYSQVEREALAEQDAQILELRQKLADVARFSFPHSVVTETDRLVPLKPERP